MIEEPVAAQNAERRAGLEGGPEDATAHVPGYDLVHLTIREELVHALVYPMPTRSLSLDRGT